MDDSISIDCSLKFIVSTQHWVDIGNVTGVFGLKGWVRVYSYTAPRKNILDYSPWFLYRDGEYIRYNVVDGACHGRGIIVKLEGVDNPEEAAELKATKIQVSRDQLGPLEQGEYYWIDLEGLNVVTESGELLGDVDHLIETGANDVLVVKGERERLLPFVQGQVIKKIDMKAGKIIVDWDPDF